MPESPSYNYPSQPRVTGSERVAWRYDCELSADHIAPALLPKVRTSRPIEDYIVWDTILKDTVRPTPDPLGHMAIWIRQTLQQMPAGIDISRDVDGGGTTRDKIEAKLFSEWVTIDDGTTVRFSEARTAMHGSRMTTAGMSRGGALRSPVMGGIALEATSNPASTDPRDAVTLALFGFATEDDARYPWIAPQPGKLFNMTPFNKVPYTVGPLYNGHPNEVSNPATINRVLRASALALRLIVESNLEND